MKHDFHELRLEQVTRRFAGSGGHVFNALSELTMTIRRGEFIALLGLGNESARFDVTMRQGPPSWAYVTIVLTLVLFFEVLPYLEELVRSLRANRGALIPKNKRR